MKVTLVMAATPNGMIATEDDKMYWVSEKSFENYIKMVRKVGCCIIGRRTYEIIPPSEFKKGCLYVVFSSKRNLKRKAPNIIFTDENPKVFLKRLEKKGIKQVCLCGGGGINTSFMKAGLIDEIYLDIEPHLLGKGIKLFAEENFEAKLKLLGIKKFSKNELQLHYKVLK